MTTAPPELSGGNHPVPDDWCYRCGKQHATVSEWPLLGGHLAAEPRPETPPAIVHAMFAAMDLLGVPGAEARWSHRDIERMIDVADQLIWWVDWWIRDRSQPT